MIIVLLYFIMKYLDLIMAIITDHRIRSQQCIR